MKKIRASLRLGFGALTAAVVFGVGLPVHSLILKPLGQHTAFQKLVYNLTRKFLGIKLVYKGAQLEKKRPAFFIANHLSNADFLTIGSAVNATFVSKGEVATYPVIGKLGKAFNIIFVRRTADYLPIAKEKVANTFAKKINVGMFPEATTTNGTEMYEFKAGLLSILFNRENMSEKTAEILNKVVVQPIAQRVVEVNGKDVSKQSAAERAELWDEYVMHNELNSVKRIWKRLQVKSITVELTALEPMVPANYADGKALANEAWKNVAAIVVPDQKTPIKKPLPLTPGEADFKKPEPPKAPQA
jgi:1-acyl-sn-glycerol-3-phosphate acyltransferase